MHTYKNYSSSPVFYAEEEYTVQEQQFVLHTCFSELYAQYMASSLIQLLILFSCLSPAQNNRQNSSHQMSDSAGMCYSYVFSELICSRHLPRSW